MASLTTSRTASALRLRRRLIASTWALPLLGSLLLAVALRAPFAEVALSPDEGGVAWVAQQWTSAHGSLYGGQWLDRPPLLVGLYWLAGHGGALGIRALGAAAALALVALAASIAGLVAGSRAARIAGLLAALLTGSVAISAVYAPAELLAAVPAAGSIAALLLCARSGRFRWLAVAGALAVAALLVKQSFLDAGLAGVAFLGWWTATRRRGRARAWGAYAAGAGAALVPVAAWMLLAHLRVADVYDALIGFRGQSLVVLQGSDRSLLHRLTGLVAPAFGSGLVVLLPLAAIGVWRVRRDRLVAVTLAAWTAGGAVGVVGGGSYWTHYLIQLLVPASVGAALTLAAAPQRVRRVTLAVATALAIAASSVGGVVVAAHPVRAAETRTAAYIREHAQPGDTFYALYARANLNDAVGLPTPFPYSWSLMLRARPGATDQLLRLLRSPQRPTWIAEWQAPSAWQLDPHGRIAAALRAHYREATSIAGHPVLVRTDHPSPQEPNP